MGKATPVESHLIPELGLVKANIKIGGDEIGRFVPNVNFSYECRSEDIYKQEHYFFNINAKNIITTDEKADLDSDTLQLSLPNENHIWKPDNNKLLWDIEFLSRPPVNQWEWAIKYSPSIHFSYQDTLENEFYNYGGEGCETLNEYLEKAERPDDVVGGYCIFGNKKWKVKDWTGRVRANFSTGKLGIIYAPYFTDAIGGKIKGTLFIKGSVLRIGCDPTWLDNAVYPVTLDPTFGHTDAGDSKYDLEDRMRGSEGTPTAGDGTLDYLYVSCADWDAGFLAKMALYVSSGLAYVANSDCPEQSGPKDDYTFYQFTPSGNPAITNNTDYLSMALGDGTTIRVAYDAESCTRFYQSRTYEDGWPDPAVGTYGSSTYHYSTYGEYTVSGAGGAGVTQHSTVLAQRRRILGSGSNTGLPIL